MATHCLICGGTSAYIAWAGSYCEDCYWEITHEREDPNDATSYKLVKGVLDDGWTLYEWLERMAKVAKAKGL